MPGDQIPAGSCPLFSDSQHAALRAARAILAAHDLARTTAAKWRSEQPWCGTNGHLIDADALDEFAGMLDGQP
jgi:hypothetical protein